MTVYPAPDIVALNADIARRQTAVSPPFRWPKYANDRGIGCDRDVRRSGISANINARAFSQFIEAL